MSGCVEVTGLTSSLEALTGAVEELRDQVERAADACALLALVSAFERWTDDKTAGDVQVAIEALVARVARRGAGGAT